MDIIANVQWRRSIDGSHLLDLAKEIIRIAENDKDISNFSLFNWSRAMLRYMDDTGKKYKHIHSMSTYELREDVKKYLEKEDD